MERKRLTSGTTWHAAGLVTQARPTFGTREIVKRSLETFQTLEAETGLSTGYVQTGTVHLAMTEDRWEELRRRASVARGSYIRAELLGPDATVELFPLLNPDGVVGSLYYPDEGRGNATDTTMSLAKGARGRGVQIFEDAEVTGVLRKNGRAVGVTTGDGEIEAEYVVNCTGLWGREFAAEAGVRVPLQALAHYYVVTDEIPGVPSGLPTLKSSDDYAYVKDEAGGLMVGFFEPDSYPWASDGIPADSEFVTLPEDWDHLGPYYEKMIERVPVLADAGIRLHFCGPESFTPDGIYHLGEVPGLGNYFVAAGFNSVGFLSGPGAGSVLADWIVDGSSPIDLVETDPRRVQPHETNRRFLEQRVSETLDIAYEVHWPFQQRESARGLRRSPLHQRLDAAGAVFGELLGWERANWYAPAGGGAADDVGGAGRASGRTRVERRYEYSFGRQNWFEHSAAEHRAVRERVGLFDLSPFGKLLVQGRDAERALQRICAGDVAVEPGRIVYTQWLNETGGIEADVTVTRLDADRFLVLSAPHTVLRDLDWLRRHVSPDDFVTVTDVGGTMAMLAVTGPDSRRLLQALTDADLKNEAFPFGTSREIDLGLGYVRATRITYVGELGWELLIPAEYAVHIYDTITDARTQFELRHAGYHALNSLRMEKAYRSWGHDISGADSPLQAGLSFAVDWDKPDGFIGREALLRQREAGISRRLVQFALDDPDQIAYHEEPIYRDGELVGRVASAMYGHTLGRCVALGYVTAPTPGLERAWYENGSYEIEIGTQRCPARASLRPMYDPKSVRPKS